MGSSALSEGRETVRRKYNNRKTVVNGITFDSAKEAKRYKELKLMEDAGEIRNLQLQVPFDLIPAQYECIERYGKRGQPLKPKRKTIEQKVTYVADFMYQETSTGNVIVEDTKGMRTKEYILKRKMMLFFHGVRIKEV